MHLIDLTHSFTADMPVYPGDPKSSLTKVATIEKEGFTDHTLNTPMHVGTHMDAPLHMIAGGMSMDAISPEHFFGPGILIDARGKTVVDTNLIPQLLTAKGAFVLVYTGFETKWKTDDYLIGYPPITESFAKRMVELGVSAIGMDMLGPDEPPFPTHKILLGNGILIIENLTNLGLLVGKTFDVTALPAKLAADAAPVRVIAQIK